MGNKQVEAENLFDLALVYAEAGRPHDVIAMQRQAIRVFTRAGAWSVARAMANGTFRTLIALGEHRVACLLMAHVRASSLPHAQDQNVIPARLEAQLEAEVGAIEMARLIEHGQQLTVSALVAEVLQALDDLSA